MEKKSENGRTRTDVRTSEKMTTSMMKEELFKEKRSSMVSDSIKETKEISFVKKINIIQMKTKNLIVTTGLAIATLCLALPNNAMAQKTFTLEDLNFGGKNFQNLRAENRYTTWWGDQIVHLENNKCSIVNPNTLKETTLFTLDDINAILSKDNSDRTVRSLFHVSFPSANQPLVQIPTRKELLTINFKTKKIEAQPKLLLTLKHKLIIKSREQ